jgi:3-dehydroquinate synthase
MENTHTMIRRNVRLDFQHSVYFTREAFSTGNETLAKILRPTREGRRSKVILYLDEGLLDGNPNLPQRINQYFRAHVEEINLVHEPLFINGG